MSKTSKPHRNWKRWLLRFFLIYVATPWIVISIIFMLFQRKLLYRPTVADDLSVQQSSLPFDSVHDVELKTEDGSVLKGWHFQHSKKHHSDDDLKEGEAANVPHLLMIYFPGNSLNRKERLTDLLEMTHCGFDLLIFDYRGFGDSSGSPNESQLTGDAKRIWKFATETLGYSESKIVIFGESLGGAVAISLWDSDSQKTSEFPRPAALVLSSTFASLRETVQWHYPYFLFQYCLWDTWNSIDIAPRVQVPVIVTHGTADAFVPIEQGKRLSEAFPNCEWIEVSDGEHNDIPMFVLRTKLKDIREKIATPDR